MSAYPSPERLHFDDERRLAWLGPLLDAYHRIDQGVHEGVRREELRGRRLACSNGCSACCRTHLTIPIYPLELMGLYWYCGERLEGALRRRIQSKLEGFVGGAACPFLVDAACAVHPMRPIACRQFNVFDRVCAEGEDAFHSRRGDVLTPLRRYADEAYDLMLPFYGVTDRRERKAAIKTGRIHALARVLQEFDWTKLAQRMGQGGAEHPGEA